MTLTTLLKEVYSLGFEDAGELDEAFIFSANRALGLIFSELVGEKRASVIVTSPKLSYYLESYSHASGEALTLRVVGRALSFRYSGNGEYLLTDGRGERKKSFSSKTGEARELLSGESKITFLGENSYLIADLAVFESLTDGTEAGIPIAANMIRIPLAERFADLLIATRPPCDRHGLPIEGASIEGDIMMLPREFEGEAVVYYKRAPRRLTLDEADGEVDIPRHLEPLLPLLAASYLWLDDDAEKAEYYMRLYREEASRIRLTLHTGHDSRYFDVTGWA